METATIPDPDVIEHRLDQSYDAAGGMTLSCPLCGYAVRWDLETGERTTKAWGDAQTVVHSWAGPGVKMGVQKYKDHTHAEGESPSTCPA